MLLKEYTELPNIQMHRLKVAMIYDLLMLAKHLYGSAFCLCLSCLASVVLCLCMFKPK